MVFSKSSILFLGCYYILISFLQVLFPTTILATPFQDAVNPETNDVVIQGEVLASGNPVPNATIAVFQDELVAQTVSDKDGKFQASLDSLDPVTVLVMAKGKTNQLRSVNPQKKPAVRIRLKEQKKPLTGRIVDNQGVGVANAKLRLERLQKNDSSIEIPLGFHDGQFETSTNEEGVFWIDGVEPAMVESTKVTGDGIVSSSISSKDFENEIVLIAQPAKTIRGVIVDETSNTPVSNVEVSFAAGNQQVQNDASGKFALDGLPAFAPVALVAQPIGKEPYLATTKVVPVENGFDPVEIEISLQPGVWAKCQVKDFVTNGPASADVYYFPTPENENFQSFVQRFQIQQAAPSTRTDAAGNAKIVAIPGPGLVAVFAEGFPANESVSKLSDEQRTLLTQIVRRNDLTAVASINPKDLKETIELDFLVSKGRAIAIELTDNQLDPTDFLTVHRAASKNSYSQRIQGNKVVAKQFHPGETRQILIHAVQKSLGAVLDLKAEAESPVSVNLKPTGSISGRLVDKDGVPQQGLLMKFEVVTDDGYQEIAKQIFTNANGQFETPSLIASLEYRVSAVRLSKQPQMMMGALPAMDSRWYVAEELKINSGEAVDLGSIELGAANLPEPTRKPIARNQTVKSDNETKSVLPPEFSGVVTDTDGEPIAGAILSFSTWESRTGNLKDDLLLKPTVLAQSRSDANGSFQMTMDPSLEGKLISSKVDNNEINAGIVIVSEQKGTYQIPLSKIAEPRNVKVTLNREMIIRGRISSDESEDQKIQLTPGAKLRVYDNESVRKIVAGLKAGESWEDLSKQFLPESILDPLAGGIPLDWQVSSSGTILVRNVPLNAIFELHASNGAGQPKTILVVSQPIRGFEIKLTKDSPTSTQLFGSRINLNLGQQQ